ncbi:hypothetical protein HY3_06285 [Hyphomonas pacifica]|uniref:Uncharacterized protein n=1 Tax=Hyphomonas pacifica TaxID=1280941 RepID=A0A062TYB9_9PROT|nr:hypothetical protein HY2_05315 [Hyphomonas pacifica]RAN30425.1 hypothetical protein HY3_06285 [Hyphomonas pacifica]
MLFCAEILHYGVAAFGGGEYIATSADEAFGFQKRARISGL